MSDVLPLPMLLCLKPCVTVKSRPFAGIIDSEQVSSSDASASAGYTSAAVVYSENKSSHNSFADADYRQRFQKPDHIIVDYYELL